MVKKGLFVVLAAALFVSQNFARAGDSKTGISNGLKIGVVILGACAVGYGVYKWVTKAKPTDEQTLKKEATEYENKTLDKQEKLNVTTKTKIKQQKKRAKKDSGKDRFNDGVRAFI